MFLELNEINFTELNDRFEVKNYPVSGLYLVTIEQPQLIKTKSDKEPIKIPPHTEFFAVNKEKNLINPFGVLSHIIGNPDFDFESKKVSFEEFEASVQPTQKEIQRLAMKDEDFINRIKSDAKVESRFENERLLAEKQSKLLFSPDNPTAEMISSLVVDQQFVLELSKILLNRS